MAILRQDVTHSQDYEKFLRIFNGYLGNGLPLAKREPPGCYTRRRAIRSHPPAHHRGRERREPDTSGLTPCPDRGAALRWPLLRCAVAQAPAAALGQYAGSSLLIGRYGFGQDGTVESIVSMPAGAASVTLIPVSQSIRTSKLVIATVIAGRFRM